MDSRTGFAILLVLVGIVGVWLAFTGKLQQIIASAQSPVTPPGLQNTAGQAGASAGAGGSWGTPTVAPAPALQPGTIMSGSPTTQGAAIGVVQPLGTPASLLIYQNAIGNDGAAIGPIGSATFGGIG